MDTAYIAPQIAEHSRSLGHVPIIAPRRKANKTQNIIVQPKQPRQMTWAEQDRYRERTMAERVNARLKDTFGCRQIFVRGHAKVTAHLMFAVVALAADQILRLIRP
jgi:transposase